MELAVSTHSRPKAAAASQPPSRPTTACFNTQPPEGGCQSRCRNGANALRFNTQPPEGGCSKPASGPGAGEKFQHTAARRRLPAGLPSAGMEPRSFNTQPPEGGCARRRNRVHTSHRFNTQPPEGGCEARVWAWGRGEVSTHSRPKAAAREQLRAYAEVLFQHTAARRRLPLLRDRESMPCWFQHTAARRRLPRLIYTYNRPHKFQHTAARRRLRLGAGGGGACVTVSTHSRPKAAARIAPRRRIRVAGFNTQPPEGGCKTYAARAEGAHVSTHSRPKAAARLSSRLLY